MQSDTKRAVTYDAPAITRRESVQGLLNKGSHGQSSYPEFNFEHHR
jgi:hypothetical protein